MVLSSLVGMVLSSPVRFDTVKKVVNIGGNDMGIRNHEVTAIQKLLDEEGSLREPGWSRQLLQVYDRKECKASKFRIKEWDYYIIMTEDYGAAFTICDAGYIGLQSVSFLLFREGFEHTETILNPFPMGKFKLPSSSREGNTLYRDKRLHMQFLVEQGSRRILCEFKNFCKGKDFSCDITLHQPQTDTLVIATPFSENRKAFYYNQKINCMPASGKVIFDGKEYEFIPDRDFGTLDWGRGIWTYDNVWYWGSGNGIIEGKPFGFNIGYGFGDTRAATENIIFYDGIGHKLEEVAFHIPEDSYRKPWHFTSGDNRFEMEFQPVLHRKAHTKAIIIETEQHQVFGRLRGSAVLDDGKVLKIQDIMCFAERVHNRY